MLINEEQGELTFSVLARGLHANPGRSIIDQVSKKFITTREQMKMAKDLGLDFATSDLESGVTKAGNVIKDEDVSEAVVHFKRMMRQFRDGQWRPVKPSEAKKQSLGVNQTGYAELLDLKMREDVTIWDPQVEDSDVDRLVKRAKAAMLHKNKTWVYKDVHGNIWDDFKPLAPPVAVPSDNDDEDDTDALPDQSQTDGDDSSEPGGDDLKSPRRQRLDNFIVNAGQPDDGSDTDQPDAKSKRSKKRPAPNARPKRRRRDDGKQKPVPVGQEGKKSKRRRRAKSPAARKPSVVASGKEPK